ncbi:fasciclin domain-containing protein [Mucilaginibacter sp. BJC16-A38]|uniref:fasciclin domain-containing protein n=1 Tax=Mucilaginibacter phenanthrenivorans TaxID=1234842 RepID=UPI0021575038|nr:fasciclin domain-containing protein [Mucilaginibacter phenanthrenivorans]MCR8556077.1 fasciclin domain-containing protein [Mucilaginibacter phenanthrenivorans]
MKKSILILAAGLSIGLLSNNVFAQTQPQPTPTPTQPTPMPTPTPTQPTPTQPVPNPNPTPTTQPATPQPTAAKADSVKDLQATIANVADLSTLTSAVKAANADATLKGAGPYTLFAPDNAAFSAIPKTKLDSLMKDPVKLGALVKAHVVVGKYDKAGIIKALTNASRTATLKTVDGQTITIAVVNKKVQLKDAQGNTAEITSFDTPATNGIIDGVNGVLMSK